MSQLFVFSKVQSGELLCGMSLSPRFEPVCKVGDNHQTTELTRKSIDCPDGVRERMLSYYIIDDVLYLQICLSLV